MTSIVIITHTLLCNDNLPSVYHLAGDIVVYVHPPQA